MKIYLGADHGGFELKESIKAWLISSRYPVEDCGNTVLDPADDYPQFAFLVAQNVVSEAEAVGILFCRSGGGMVIAANKVRGIRAVDVFDLTSAVHAKTHNNSNVISLGADWMNQEEAKLVIKNFLETAFSSDDRHVRRLQQIADFEVTASK